MAQMKIPAPKKVYTKRYSMFRGVDFSTDPALVDDSRSPYAKNIVADSGGYPEKRLGWHTVETFEGTIHGIYSLYHDGELTILVHHGNSLSTLDGVSMYGNMNDDYSSGFVFEDKLYILDGASYLVYDGTAVSEVIGFIPTTTIGAPPAGGGDLLEAVNLITPYRINSFYGDGSTKAFHLDADHLDDAEVSAVVDGVDKRETTDFTVNRTTGVVTFTTAPSDGGGVDNVTIKFAKTIPENEDRITGCSVCAWFGAGNDSRLFVSGNPDYPSMDWQSGLYDPTYFPDTGYTKIGTDNSRIMGYLKQFSNLLVIKEDNDQDATIYMRTAELDKDNVANFPLKQGVVGVGAISKKSFSTLNDDPLFLSQEGVFSPTLSYGVNQERKMQNRSFFIDSRLTKEPNLETACAATWNGFYVLCVNNHCYVADQRQKSKANNTSAYTYEWFYWDNIPAHVFMEHDGDLYFGTTDGRVCMFNTNVVSLARYNDDDEPIDAVWATKMDDDGDFMTQKTIPKKGTGLMIKPYSKSSIDIWVRTNKDMGRKARSASMDVFDFNDVDFSRFTFETNDSPMIVPLMMKVKKYSSAQIIARNNALNEGFGVYGFVKRFNMGNYVK